MNVEVGDLVYCLYPCSKTGELRERVGTVEQVWPDGFLLELVGNLGYRHLKYDKCEDLSLIDLQMEVLA